jgi:hypothetical protein
MTSFLCKVKITLLQSKFFPPNFSLVFWKRKIWGEGGSGNYSSIERIYFAKEVFQLEKLSYLIVSTYWLQISK